MTIIKAQRFNALFGLSEEVRYSVFLESSDRLTSEHKVAKEHTLWMIVAILLLFTYHVSAQSLKEADFYKKLDDNAVQCQLCPRRCILSPNQKGVCRVRENQKGKLYALTYGKPCTVSVEPIEKAPFFHFIPGHKRLCIATVGCNLRCKYCQNWQISQKSVDEVSHYDLSTEDIIKIAKMEKVKSICFTFTEPVVSYEYIYEIAKLAHEEGIKTSVVSAGYINPEPLKKLIKVLDAVKIDLKGFTEDFYTEVTGGTLQPVLNTLKILKEENKWFEIVNLIVPTVNDNPEDIKKMCEWIKENLGDEVPVHFIRFHPAYKLTRLQPTPIETLEKAHKIAKDVGLKYVYIGNVPGHEYNSTFCPYCGKRLIHRVGFSVLENNIANGKCKFCGGKIAGVWE
jgi:pyruvate formate lyase activating enzyme